MIRLVLRPKSPFSVAALAVAGLLLLGACSSDGGSASNRDSTSSGSTQNESSVSDQDAAGSDVGLGLAADSLVDYETEPVGSALRGDRNNSEFPPALVDISDIQNGGPAPDGIPPIDDPVFASVSDTTYLSDNEAVIVVEVNGDARAYPVQVLIWHEIVNDTIGGEPITVTYCPLCNSALAFNRQFGSRTLDFGTSGELYQSALVMYDRQTESLWAHFTGQGIVGHYAGAQLDLVPAQTLAYRDYVLQYPEGQVLTTETGVNRSYGINPYVGYDNEASDPFGQFISQDIDDALAPKVRVVGVMAPSGPFAVPLADITSTGLWQSVDVVGPNANETDGADVDDTVGTTEAVIFYKGGLNSPLDTGDIADGKEIGQTGVFVPLTNNGEALTFAASPNGKGYLDDQTGTRWTITGTAIEGELAGEQLASIPHVDTFWFAWSTYRPTAALYQHQGIEQPPPSG